MALVVELNGLFGGFQVVSRGYRLEDQAVYGGADQNFAYQAGHYD